MPNAPVVMPAVMPVVMNVDELEWGKVQRGRVNAVRTKQFPLDSGIPGVVLEFSYALIPDGYFTPRHRHSFDQIRLGLDGIFSIKGIDLGPGDCGYYSEGVYYGPQQQKGDAVILILQFQGANGERFLSNPEINETHAQMVDEGAVFEDGVYRGKKKDGRPDNKDSFRAIWEHRLDRKLEYPKPRYREPVMMQPERFRWTPDRNRPGISMKHLGTFTELRTGVAYLRMAGNATLAGGKQGDAEIRYLLDGEVIYGDRRCGKGTYFYLPCGADVEDLRATSEATFFTISLPMLSQLAAPEKGVSKTQADSMATS